MRKATKRLVSFLTAASMTLSLFTFAFAANDLTASYDKEDDIVTVENIPNTGDLLNITIVKGTVALDDIASTDVVGFSQGSYASSKEITIGDTYLVNGDLPDGTYTVYIGGSNGTHKSCTFVVGNIEATYDATTNKVTVSKLSTAVSVQTIYIKDSTGTNIVYMDEFSGDKIASTQELPLPDDIANGEYTVYVSDGTKVQTCTVTVARAAVTSITAEYDAVKNVVVVKNIPTTGVTVQTVHIKDSTGANTVGMEEFSGNEIKATQEIPVAEDIAEGEYTVYVGDGTDKTPLTCKVTVTRATSIMATYDAAANKVTVKNLATDVTNQMIMIQNSLGNIVGMEEFSGDEIASTQELPMPTAVENGEYTVYVSYGDKVFNCKVNVTGATAPTATPESTPTPTPTATATAEPTATATAAPTATATAEPTATTTATPDSTTRPLPTATPTPASTQTPTPTKKPSSGGFSGGGIIYHTTAPTTNPGNNNNNNNNTTNKFQDMTGYEWANTAVNTLVEMGILDGRSETIFAPEASVTRAEFTKMVCGAMGLPEKTNATQIFDDVPETHWAYGYIAMAVQLGIVGGYTDNEFRPDEPISREQMATILYRAIVACKNESRLPDGTPVSFDDYDKISDYAKSSVDALSAAGVINGITDTAFGPQMTANRVQAASIIHQYFKAIGVVQ